MAAKAHSLKLKQTTQKFRNRRQLIRPTALSSLPIKAVEPEDTSPSDELETPMITPELKKELSSPLPSIPAKGPTKKKRTSLQSVPPASDSNFLGRLANELGIQAQRLNIFSTPVDRDHLTIIPVSQVFYGMTGESLRKNASNDPWAAGALHASPLGYIEIKNGRSEFRKIPSRGLAPLLPILLKSGSFLLLILRRVYENYLRKEK